MIISVVFVSMMVVFVTVYYFVAKPKKQQEKIYSCLLYTSDAADE